AHAFAGREPVRPLGDRSAAHRLDRWLQMLPAPGARGDPAGPRAVQRLCLPDRDELPGVEAALSAQRGSHRLHRPGRRSEQDEQENRAGGDLDGLVASNSIAYGAGMKGTVFYKMTGSGNDFILLDGRSTTSEQWPGPRIAALCDRRDGVGADGLVILTPEDGEGVRMTFFNSDG